MPTQQIQQQQYTNTTIFIDTKDIKMICTPTKLSTVVGTQGFHFLKENVNHSISFFDCVADTDEKTV